MHWPEFDNRKAQQDRFRACLTPLLTGVMCVIFSLYSPLMMAHVAEESAGHYRFDYHAPGEVVALFKKAVDAGELTLFGKTLANDDLMPERVEYVYELSTAQKRLRIHARLKQAIKLPEPIQCLLQAVTVTLDADGHIVDVESLVQPD